MHRAHDLARQRAERGGDDLERRERHRDPEQRAALEVVAPALLQPCLGLGLARDGRRRRLGGEIKVGHLSDFPKLVIPGWPEGPDPE